MEDIASTILTIIPIALFVGIRILIEQRKKQKKETQGKLAEMLVSLSRDRPTQSVSVRSAEDEFDAHSLVPDDDEEESPSPPPPAPPRAPIAKPLWESAPVLPITVSAPLPTEYAAYVPPESPAATARAEPDHRAAVPAKTTPAAAADSAPSSGIGRLDRLPPLKRAVVLAEVLGTPKGL